MSDKQTTARTCRVCGCIDDNCSQCIEAQGFPCHWVEDDLCSRCAGDFKLSKERIDEIVQECDDTGGFLIKQSTLKYFIEREIKQDRQNRRNEIKESYIKECIILKRKDEKVEYLFRVDAGKAQFCLERYAIIPRETYERLLKLEFETFHKEEHEENK